MGIRVVRGLCASIPEGCQTVAGGRQTSGRAGKEGPTRNGSQRGEGMVDRAHGHGMESSSMRGFVRDALACLRHANPCYPAFPEVERVPSLALRPGLHLRLPSGMPSACGLPSGNPAGCRCPVRAVHQGRAKIGMDEGLPCGDRLFARRFVS